MCNLVKNEKELLSYCFTTNLLTDTQMDKNWLHSLSNALDRKSNQEKNASLLKCVLVLSALRNAQREVMVWRDSGKLLQISKLQTVHPHHPKSVHGYWTLGAWVYAEHRGHHCGSEGTMCSCNEVSNVRRKMLSAGLGALNTATLNWLWTWPVTSAAHRDLECRVTDGLVIKRDVQPRSAHAGLQQWLMQVDHRQHLLSRCHRAQWRIYHREFEIHNLCDASMNMNIKSHITHSP